jgi:TolB-like protein
MNRGPFAAVIALVCMLFALPVPAQDRPPRVAVIPFSAIQVSKAEAEILTGLFETSLVKTGAFNVIEQTRVHEILEAQEYSLSDCTDEACAVKFGKLLAAERIVLGSCSSLGGRFVLNAKIIDVALGTNLAADRVDADSLTALADRVDELAGSLAGIPPAQTASPREPAPAPAAAASSTSVPQRLGELFVETDPSGAEIHINGVRKGTSPELFSRVPAGPVTVEAYKNGLYARQDLVVGESMNRIRLTLSKLYGVLFIKASDPEVRVLLDGKDIGRLGSGFFEKVPAGIHVLELRGRGLYWKGDVTIKVDESTRLEIELKEYGTLRYRLPDGVRAEISGRNITTAVTGTGELEYLDVGPYQVSVSGDGYQPFYDTFTVERGSRIELRPDMVRSRAYEEGRLRSLLDEIERYLGDSRAFDQVPRLLNDLERLLGNSIYAFDELRGEFERIRERFEVLRLDREAKLFEEEIAGYRIALGRGEVRERDVRDFEKKLQNFKPQSVGGASTVRTELTVQAELLLKEMRVAVLKQYKTELEQRIVRAEKGRREFRKVGWIGFGIGVVFGGIAGLSWHYEAEAGDRYIIDPFLQSELRTANGWRALKWVSFGISSGGFGTALFCGIFSPRPDRHRDELFRVDLELAKLEGPR